MSFVDRDGDPVTIERYIEITRAGGFGEPLMRSVVPTDTGDMVVLTVWNGFVLPECDVRPFATGVAALRGGAEGAFRTLEQYDRPADARRGHTRHCARLGGLAGDNPVDARAGHLHHVVRITES